MLSCDILLVQQHDIGLREKLGYGKVLDKTSAGSQAEIVKVGLCRDEDIFNSSKGIEFERFYSGRPSDQSDIDASALQERKGMQGGLALN